MSSNASYPNQTNRWKFIVAGLLIAAAVVVMIVSATQATAEFFLTVRELLESDRDLTGRNLRVSGAVLGDSIKYNRETGLLTFTIAHISNDEKEIERLGGLEAALHQAVIDANSPRLNARYAGFPPDMLRHEAQAILTGTLDSEGVFVAEELLLKCPSRYEEALPEQAD